MLLTFPRSYITAEIGNTEFNLIPLKVQTAKHSSRKKYPLNGIHINYKCQKLESRKFVFEQHLFIRMLIYATCVLKLAMLKSIFISKQETCSSNIYNNLLYFQYFIMKLAGFVSNIFLFHIISTCTSCEPFQTIPLKLLQFLCYISTSRQYTLCCIYKQCIYYFMPCILIV